MDTLVSENKQNGKMQSPERFVAPSATVFENENGYGLTLEMPGVTKENLDVSVENNELTIIGRRSLPEVGGTLIYRELGGDTFRRVFELDPSIDTAKITATIEQGLVTLSLPKSEQVKARKISVS